MIAQQVSVKDGTLTSICGNRAYALKCRRVGARCVPAGSKLGRQSSLIVKAIAQEVKQTVDAEPLKFTAFDRVEVLSESLPYLQAFRGKTIVVKYGGAAMKDPSLMGGVINDLVLLSTVGILPVLVHGGGPEINQWLKKVGIESKFDPETGLRVTDEATMEVVQAVLAGTVNKNLVRLIQQAGGKAVGLCGIDGGLIMARQEDGRHLPLRLKRMVRVDFRSGKPSFFSVKCTAQKVPEGTTGLVGDTTIVDASLVKVTVVGSGQVLEGRIGLVGDITSIDASVVKVLVGSSFLPVISSVALDLEGRSLNVNADIAAGEIAAALKAEKLILMTDVPGVMRDKNDIATKFTNLSITEVRELIADGTIAGGMIPKVECCVRCLAQGVRAAHIIDGRQRHSLLMELLTDVGVGTMITG